MNGNSASNAELISGIVAGLKASPVANCSVGVCPPSVYLGSVAQGLAGSEVKLGGQDVSAHAKGAYTGEISAVMLKELGCELAIVGHSERRQYHAEAPNVVGEKAAAVLDQGLTPIVCVGETLAEHDAGLSFTVVQNQMAGIIKILGERLPSIILAYEPVWAIGTGRTATPAQAQTIHALLRAQVAAAVPAAVAVPILYGGSVKPDNAGELFAQPDIDGGLIGGASLKASDFLAICRAAG
jgi:triosephosphate isomerase